MLKPLTCEEIPCLTCTPAGAELGIGLVQSRFSFEPAVRKADLTNDCKNVTDVQAGRVVLHVAAWPATSLADYEQLLQSPAIQ